VERVCPLCNGLRDANVQCGACGQKMEDGGVYTDYEDDYAPYELTAHVRQQNEGRCTHLLFCAACGKQQYLIVQSEWM